LALGKKLGKFFLTIGGGEDYMIDHVINHMIARLIPPDPMALPLKLVNEDGCSSLRNRGPPGTLHLRTGTIETFFIRPLSSFEGFHQDP